LHRVPRSDGGETKLSNLVLLCRFHHRRVHEGRVQVRMLDDGALRFTGARGQELENALPAVGDADALLRAHANDAHTAVTRWRGERLDYDLAIWCLMNNPSTARKHDVSAKRVVPRLQHRAWMMAPGRSQLLPDPKVRA
jgi:hypothetical protein